MELFDVPFDEAENFLLRPQSVLIYSLLRCAPCTHLKDELEILLASVESDWRIGVCTIFGRSLLRLKEVREVRHFPTVMIKDGHNPVREFGPEEAQDVGRSTAVRLIMTLNLGLSPTVMAHE